MNTQLQDRNAEMVHANNKANDNISKMQSNINKINSNINKMKPVSSSDSIKRDELNELYEFVFKYDGTLGETALIFRENVKNYAQYVYDNSGTKYNEARMLSRIIKSFTGDAQIKYSSRQGQRFNTLDGFYEWFDTEFQLSSLRADIHKQLMNWEIDANTQNNNIVREYKKKLNLFNITTTTSSRALINSTPLPTATQITSIIKSIQYTKPIIYKYIDAWVMRHLDQPQTLSELEGVIKGAVKYIETQNINSNEKHTDPSKISSVNAIQAENYSQYTDNSQHGNGFRGGYRSGRGFHGGYRSSRGFRGGYRSGRGFRGNFNRNIQPGTEFHGNYDQNKQPGTEFHGNYDQNKQPGTEFHGNYDQNIQPGSEFYVNDNRNTQPDIEFHGDYNQNTQFGSKFRGNHRGKYSTRSRGHGRDRERGQFSRGYNNRGQNQNSWGYGPRQYGTGIRRNRYNNRSIPYYKPAICNSCKIWGHAHTQCQWIHDDFPALLEEFRKMGNRDIDNQNRTVNITQKQTKEQRLLGDDSDN